MSEIDPIATPSNPRVDPAISKLSSIPRLARFTLGDFRSALKPLLFFEAFLKGMVALVGLVGTTYVIAPLIQRTGQSAVTNTDIASFLLSPVGLAVGFLILFGTLFASVIEHVGVMVVVAIQLRRHSVTPELALSGLASILLRLIRFKLQGLLAVLLISSPFVMLAALTYLVFLHQHDINYYLEHRPPEFYLALAIGGALAVGLSIILIRLFVQSIFVVPSLIVGEVDSKSAFRLSKELTQGATRRIGGIFVAWHLIGLLLGLIVVWGFSRSAGMVLGISASWPRLLVPMVGALLVVQLVLLSLLSTLLVSVESILMLRLYLAKAGIEPDLATNSASGIPEVPKGPLSFAADATFRGLRRFWIILGMLSLIGIGFLLVGLAHRLDARPKVTVAAHRGYSKVAPENTLAAFRKAIEVGADYAELDVQETKDGQLVVIHDRDLMRVAGDPRRVSEITLDEIKKLDVGSRFSAEFAGERIPTLEESIDLAHGKIGLQIELKYYAKDAGLAEKVAALIERMKFEPECVVISLDYPALLKAKSRNPKIKTAAIITYALGDVNRLDVDALSVHTKFINRALLRAAKARGKEVYAWTVDDPHQMLNLIERGVTSLVTNVPSAAVSICRELDKLSDLDRRILTARYLLGLEPELPTDVNPATGAGSSEDSTPDPSLSD